MLTREYFDCVAFFELRCFFTCLNEFSSVAKVWDEAKDLHYITRRDRVLINFLAICRKIFGVRTCFHANYVTRIEMSKLKARDTGFLQANFNWMSIRRVDLGRIHLF